MTDSSQHSSSNNSSSGKDGSASNTSGVTFRSDKTPEELLAEDKLVRYSRYGVAATLLISAAVLSIVCFFAFRNQERNHFEGEFDILSDELERLSHSKFEGLINELQDLSTSTSSLTGYSQAQWPNVMLPFFQEQGDAFRALSHTSLLMMSPNVNDAEAWEQYVATSLDASGYSTHLHNGEGDEISSDSKGPYNPIWQMAPFPEDISVMNLDLRSVDAFRHAADVSQAYTDAVVSEISTNLAADLRTTSLPGVIPDHPHSFVVHPIHDSTELDADVVGFFVSVFTWELFLGDILHTDYPITCVLENSCGDLYTFEIKGEVVAYVGPGDQHDGKYHHHSSRAELECFLETLPTQFYLFYILAMPAFSVLSLRSYPSK